MYLDGGTVEMETSIGTYCFDNRLGSTTKGKLFKGYPKDDLSNLVPNSENLESELTEELKKQEGFEND
jgi:hypothetical protein